jgi:hypothetical protein
MTAKGPVPRHGIVVRIGLSQNMNTYVYGEKMIVIYAKVAN